MTLETKYTEAIQEIEKLRAKYLEKIDEIERFISYRSDARYNYYDAIVDSNLKGPNVFDSMLKAEEHVAKDTTRNRSMIFVNDYDQVNTTYEFQESNVIWYFGSRSMIYNDNGLPLFNLAKAKNVILNNGWFENRTENPIDIAINVDDRFFAVVSCVMKNFKIAGYTFENCVFLKKDGSIEKGR